MNRSRSQTTERTERASCKAVSEDDEADRPHLPTEICPIQLQRLIASQPHDLHLNAFEEWSLYQ